MNITYSNIPIHNFSALHPFSQENHQQRRQSAGATTYAEAAALKIPLPKSPLRLIDENASHNLTEIAKDDKITRNSSEGDSGEGEGCRRLKESSERLQGEMWCYGESEEGEITEESV